MVLGLLLYFDSSYDIVECCIGGEIIARGSGEFVLILSFILKLCVWCGRCEGLLREDYVIYYLNNS